MSESLVLISVYEKVEQKLLKSKSDLSKHLEACLDPDCCARCDNINWTILAYDTELEILLEDIKASNE